MDRFHTKNFPTFSHAKSIEFMIDLLLLPHLEKIKVLDPFAGSGIYGNCCTANLNNSLITESINCYLIQLKEIYTLKSGKHMFSTTYLQNILKKKWYKIWKTLIELCLKITYKIGVN